MRGTTLGCSLYGARYTHTISFFKDEKRKKERKKETEETGRQSDRQREKAIRM